MSQPLSEAYSQFYSKNLNVPVYPSEFIIRIFQGTYPRLSLPRNDFPGQRILDAGCGDGRNLEVFYKLGFEVFGTEISREICNVVKERNKSKGIHAEIQVAKHDRLPFPDGFFHYLVSWNSCYYMGTPENYHAFSEYSKEFSRILAPGGRLVLSVPAPDAFIFNQCKEIQPGYCIIENDPYLIRNHHVFRKFSDIQDLRTELEDGFDAFSEGSIHDDCFGQINSWMLLVCKKKGQ